MFFGKKKREPEIKCVYAGPEIMGGPKTQSTDSGKTCPSCGANVGEEAERCHACGFPLIPPQPYGSSIPQCMATYAGPEMMQNPIAPGQAGIDGVSGSLPYPLNYQVKGEEPVPGDAASAVCNDE